MRGGGHIVPVAILEAFRPLMSIGQIAGVQGPKTLQIGEFLALKNSRLESFRVQNIFFSCYNHYFKNKVILTGFRDINESFSHTEEHI